MNAAYIFRQLRDSSSDPEKRQLYEALNYMAQNIEEMKREIDQMKDKVQSIYSRVR